MQLLDLHMLQLFIVNFAGNTEGYAEFCNYDLENLVTPIRHEVLGKLLQESGYDPNETQFLIDGFRNGFDLCYFGPVN